MMAFVAGASHAPSGELSAWNKLRWLQRHLRAPGALDIASRPVRKAVDGQVHAEKQAEVVEPEVLFRLEHLAEDMPTLESRLGVKLGDLSRENASARPSSADVYTDADRAYVAELFAEDIARFGYRFPD